MRRLNYTNSLLLLVLGLGCLSSRGNTQVLTPTIVVQPTLTPTYTPTVAVTVNPTLVVLPTLTPTPPISITPNPTIIASYPTPTATHTSVNFTEPLILDANFFNPLTADLGIHFKMPSDGQAKVSIYNMVGERVKTLVDEYLVKGAHTLYWEGHNSNGALVGNAVYFIIFQYPGGQTIQKVILLK